MKRRFERYSYFLFAALLLLCAAFAHSQVQVAIAPPLHPKFTDNSGNPLASGFLYTYQAGTTTLQNTYIDSTGTVQNPDPIPLDATGAPSNGSTQTGIWLANQSYKFCAYNAALVQQWCTDNVTGYLNLLNLANTWTFLQTFSLPIVDTATDNQLVLGSPGNQTTADFPPPTGNVTLHFPSTNDTVVGRATTDTLTNKTLTSPAINTPSVNGCTVQNSPGTYVCIANANPTGTTLNGLVKLANAPSQATAAVIADTGGIVGICVATCGNTGTAVIQQSGLVNCTFDAATTAGDYVQSSPTTGNNCHDAGSSYPTTGQVLGRVMATIGGAGAAQVDFFGPEINPRAIAYPNVVYSARTGNLTTAIGTVTMVTPTIDTTYRFSAYVHQTVAGVACTGATIISVSVNYTDQAAGAPGAVFFPAEDGPNNTPTNNSGTIHITTAAAFNGSPGNFATLATIVASPFRVKGGTAVQLTGGLAVGAGCTTTPAYEVIPLLEQMAAN